MKKFTLCSVIVAFALCVAAVAQTSGAGGAQGTQGSSPSMGLPASQQPGMGSGAGQTDQNTSPNRAEKSERKLKGCVQSQGGQYVLENKKGKAVNLTGQDVSAHVGHEVALKGNFESGGAAGMSASSGTTTAGAGEKSFNVTNVEMISESCGGGKTKGTSGTMGGPGTGPGGNTPSSGTGTGTTPPQ